MRKHQNFIVQITLIALLTLLIFFSCSTSDIDISTANVVYLKGEDNSLSFLLYFQVPKGEKFELNVEISSEGGLYVWQSKARDLISNGVNYKVAGRFLLPFDELRQSNFTMTLSYRDKKESYPLLLKEDLKGLEYDFAEIYDYNVTQRGSSTSYILQDGSPFIAGDEFGYSFYVQSGVKNQVATRINTKSQALKMTYDATHLVLLERKRDERIIRTRTIDLQSL